MSEEANLDAYLRRIDYSGSIAPVLETLEALHRLHPSVIPFENLNPLMGLPVRLQLSDLEQKLLIERRGGYCFEQNLLFKAVLESMDFKVTPIAAGVLWGATPEQPAPAPDHMALIVDVGGLPYLCDVGFGALLLTAPLRLKADIEQQTPNETFRLVGGFPQWRLEAAIRGEWRALYQFELSPRSFEDYVAMNDVALSVFRDELIVARVDGPKRYGLHNGRLNTYEGGETVTRHLTSLIELREVLANVFRIQLPETERLDPALEKALRAGAAA